MNSPHLTYRDGLARGVLLYQRCTGCAAAIFPPRVVCPSCGGTDLGTEQSAGRGEVYSSTAVAASGGPAYSVCLIDLDEGFRMMSTVIDVPAEDVAIGARVALVVEDGDTPRAAFTLVAGR